MNRETRMQMIRNVLLRIPRAGFKEIQQKTGIPSKELASDLKTLLKSGDITREISIKDARRKEYELRNHEKAKMESRRFESIEFIRGLGPNLSFGEAKVEDNEFLCNCSIFTNLTEETKQNLEKTAASMAKNFLPLAVQIARSLPNTANSFKNAYIVTLEKKGVEQ